MHDSIIVIGFFLFMVVIMGMVYFVELNEQDRLVECLNAGHSIEACEQIFD